MRIVFQFSTFKAPFKFSVDYNQILQGFIYHNLSKENADFVHNSGFKSGSRTLIKLAYNTGLGSKNSQGFGVFELIKKNLRQLDN